MTITMTTLQTEIEKILERNQYNYCFENLIEKYFTDCDFSNQGLKTFKDFINVLEPYFEKDPSNVVGWIRDLCDELSEVIEEPYESSLDYYDSLFSHFQNTLNEISKSNNLPKISLYTNIFYITLEILCCEMYPGD